MQKKPKRPRDTNQLAKFIIDAATGDAELPEAKSADDGKDAAAVALGKKGGKARADSLSAKRKKEIAKKAAAARWKKKKE